MIIPITRHDRNPGSVVIGLLHHPVNTIHKPISIDTFLLFLDGPVPVDGPYDEQVPALVIHDLNSALVLVSLDPESQSVFNSHSCVEAPGEDNHHLFPTENKNSLSDGSEFFCIPARK